MLRSAGVVSSMTVLSRILGLWRDRLLAGIFGATWISDAFNLAFILPNLTRRLFGEGALSAAFVPVFSERLAARRKGEAFRTTSVLLTRLALGLLFACALLIGASFGARHVWTLPAAAALTLKLGEVMLGYCVLVNAAAVLMGVLNSLGHFAAPAAAPVLLNVCMIGACLFGGRWFGGAMDARIEAVAWAVIAGGVLQVLVMLPPALARGFKFRPRLDKSDGGYREVMDKFLPVILGVALFQLNILLDQLIARFLIPGDGPVTMLAYGNRLVQLPWALFSLAVATAALPMLSRYWAEKRSRDFSLAVGAAVRSTLYLAVPSAVGLALLSTDLVRLFYGTGAFLAGDGEAVARTGRVVFFLALGLCFYSLNAVLARALYATKDTRTPTRAAAVAVGVNLVLNLTLVLGTEMREAGLALASAISGAVQTLWLARALYRRIPPPDPKRLWSFVQTLVLGGVLSAVGAIVAFRQMDGNPNLEGFVVSLVTGLIAVGPLNWLGGRYFAKQLEPLREKTPAGDAPLRFGVPAERWPADLAFYHALYSIAIISTVMGFLVWTVRDSLPPEGHVFALVFQRAVVPVAVGVVVFVLASQGFQSREYEELKTALFRARNANGGR